MNLISIDREKYRSVLFRVHKRWNSSPFRSSLSHFPVNEIVQELWESEWDLPTKKCLFYCTRGKLSSVSHSSNFKRHCIQTIGTNRKNNFPFFLSSKSIHCFTIGLERLRLSQSKKINRSVLLSEHFNSLLREKDISPMMTSENALVSLEWLNMNHNLFFENPFSSSP